MSRPARAVAALAAAAALVFSIASCSAVEAEPAESPDPIAAQPSAEPQPSETPDPEVAPGDGSAENPFAAGTVLEFADWSVEYTAVLRDRADVLVETFESWAIEYPAGLEVVEVQYALTRTGETPGESSDVQSNLNSAAMGPASEYNWQLDGVTVAPGETVTRSEFSAVDAALFEEDPWVLSVAYGDLGPSMRAVYAPVQ